ncbi:Asp-tRNA(Asn)/Glu-tRNA(Gln) amidotransferase subunit GatC [Patescibacteria group bacterium]|nr:Asp-tRNA(Asn)/Glu-tRNA(Gln) amidotransferase subunit GatC [Patescibacteria group bacterium]MBU1778473.1 Asp-tRNA(Asn)/Glu-tRNA(Gln) amidotransferase subunit GatC [Patescibacteria group bacterium]
MKLNQKQIQHIANLARLELTEEELKKYSNQLSDILSYINQLKEADTTNVEPTAQVTGMENIFREDTVEEWDKDEIEVALEQAGELEDGQVKVGRVLA